MGLYIYTSVNQLTEAASNEGNLTWINVFGASDLVSWDAKEMPSGTTLHSQLCLHPQVAIVNMKAQSRRLIPLRGKLKIEAFYFPTEEALRVYKSERERAHYTPDASPNFHYPDMVTILADIPCRESHCNPACDQPPPILYGENRFIPDVFYLEKDWGLRGLRIDEELSQKYPACSVASPPPR